MTPPSIDLNSDVGESFGAWSIGRDSELIPLVSSVNIACGFHAGDPVVIEGTIRLAAAAGVSIGAHPGYPDLIGFGRRDLEMSRAELESAVAYQVAAVQGLVRAAGAELRHVKVHGALYNRAARDQGVAEAVTAAVRRISAELVVVGPAGSALVEAGRAAGLAVAEEAFADRAYEPDGSLRSRRLPGAVLAEPSVAAKQALAIVQHGRAPTDRGGTVAVTAQTLCIHGDSPDAPAIARAVRMALEEAGIRIRPVWAR